MFLIRNAKKEDFQAVLKLAGHLDSYNLPADKGFIKQLLKDSEASFRGKLTKTKARYLFVAEEYETKKVVGCSLIIARHGTPGLPHISFELGAEKKSSRFLRKTIFHKTLKLRVDKKGFTEIGGLVVFPAYRRRKEKIGKKLSHARFHYMAAFPEKFQRRVLVEYLPNFTKVTGGAEGESRLWQALGHKFTGLSYRQADRLSVNNKEFIISLFPKEKIYCTFLPEEVVQGLGEPGPGAKASLRILKKLGFKFLNQIDPFDGGPHYGANFREIQRQFSKR